jgi:NADPH2:quinone reductase
MTVVSKARSRTRQAETSTVPETMQAAAIDRFGGPEVLKLHTLPVPPVEKGEVLIEINTAGVGIWDAEMRAGWWPSGHPTFPLVLGTDGSGKVAALGSHIRRFKLGDTVYSYSFANPKGGFYAEYVAVAENNVATIPRGLTLEQAGAIATTALTALQGIDDALGIRRGEAMIIHGASGGVGTLAVQFAKLRGARVLATASGEDGVALVLRLDADAAVEGHHGDILAAARSFAPDGISAVLGLVGGDGLERCLDALRSGGRLAYPNGIDPEPSKRRGIHVVRYDAVAGVREFTALNIAAEAVKLQVHIAARFDLADAAKAHERLAQGHVPGKIVLRVSEHKDV